MHPFRLIACRPTYIMIWRQASDAHFAIHPFQQWRRQQCQIKNIVCSTLDPISPEYFFFSFFLCSSFSCCQFGQIKLICPRSPVTRTQQVLFCGASASDWWVCSISWWSINWASKWARKNQNTQHVMHLCANNVIWRNWILFVNKSIGCGSLISIFRSTLFSAFLFPVTHKIVVRFSHLMCDVYRFGMYQITRTRIHRQQWGDRLVFEFCFRLM